MTSISKDEPLSATPETPDAPSGIDRRAFLMRNAAIGAAAVMTGTTWAPRPARSRPRRRLARSKPPRRPREAMPVSR